MTDDGKKSEGTDRDGGGTGDILDLDLPGEDLLEPHASLRYVGRLFKGLGLAVFVLMAVEVGLGLSQDGLEALPILILEVAQLLVFAGLLWGFGDLAYLILETNHDVRASRVHLWQLNHMRQMELRKGGTEVDPVDTEESFL